MIQQIANQLNKLIDVVSVEDMTGGEHLERELVLLKLKVRPGADGRRCGVMSCAPADGCWIRLRMWFMVELTASEAEVNAFIAELGRAAEMHRSGSQRCAGHRARGRGLRVVRWTRT